MRTRCTSGSGRAMRGGVIAKKDDNESRKRRTDASAKPVRDSAMSAHETSRSETAAMRSAARAWGTSRTSAASAT